MTTAAGNGIDWIGVGVGAVIRDDQGKILMMLRGPQARNERGKWEIPGGAVEFGETLEAALKREVKEELGITIEIDELLTVCDHLLAAEKQHWVSPTYLCHIVSGVPRIQEPEKCSDVRWFSLSQAQTIPLSAVTSQDIRLLAQRYGSENNSVSDDEGR